jgi:hypothetical protein
MVVNLEVHNLLKELSTQRDSEGRLKSRKKLKRKFYELEELLNKVKTTMMKDLKMGTIDAHMQRVQIKLNKS